MIPAHQRNRGASRRRPDTRSQLAPGQRNAPREPLSSRNLVGVAAKADQVPERVLRAFLAATPRLLLDVDLVQPAASSVDPAPRKF
jgi:hypothetical protein